MIQFDLPPALRLAARPPGNPPGRPPARHPARLPSSLITHLPVRPPVRHPHTSSRRSYSVETTLDLVGGDREEVTLRNWQWSIGEVAIIIYSAGRRVVEPAHSTSVEPQTTWTIIINALKYPLSRLFRKNWR